MSIRVNNLFAGVIAPAGKEKVAALLEKSAFKIDDRIYTAQVLWDESMAEGAANWLKATPNGRVVLIAGNGHCHDSSAIVNRIKRRGVDKVVSVRPVLDIEGRVADALAKPVNDFLVVLELPPDVKAEMERSAD